MGARLPALVMLLHRKHGSSPSWLRGVSGTVARKQHKCAAQYAYARHTWQAIADRVACCSESAPGSNQAGWECPGQQGQVALAETKRQTISCCLDRCGKLTATFNQATTCSRIERCRNASAAQSSSLNDPRTTERRSVRYEQ